jgi:signal transduction histidine kinase/DNA-binding response OmpR family regulator/HPt (histidine-containing phosphotransfer) domain-containing protein
MIWQQTPYTFPLFATALLTLAAALYAYRQRHVPGALFMARMMLAVMIWVVFYALELNTADLAGKKLWSKLQYIGIVDTTVSYFLFVLHYIGAWDKMRQNRTFLITLHLIPAITLLLAWTNESHHLLWQSTRLLYANRLSYLHLGHGPWFWVFIGYSYLLLLASTLLLLRRIATVSQHFRGQLAFTILGSLSPWLGNLFYITNSETIVLLDYTVFGFSVTAVCFMWALFHFSFLDLVPMAQEMVLQKVAGGVIVVDNLNRVIELNDTAVALLNQEKSQILGTSFIPANPAWASVGTLLIENRPGCVELILGEEYFEAYVSLLDSVSRQGNGRLITLHNITQQKNTELLLKRAKEAAEAADRAKTHFLTNMSHEIRTPLNAVVGVTEMLRQTQLNPNQREMLEMVTQSSNNLMLLINNILDFAKLEAGNLALNKQTFDLVDCVTAALDSVRPAAQDKRLQLNYRIEPATPTALMGDPVRLRQILVNLLENGIKFTEAGSVEIHVSNLVEQENYLLQFSVIDTGIGIAADQIESLFLPFSQVDGSMTREYSGNGLGLVVCQRLVALMEGSIYLTSTIGQGTAVHFTAQFSPAPKDQSSRVTLRHHQTTLVNKRLLLVTREASHRRHISKEARVAGLEVYAAGSSHEASYWIANSQPFDAALLDTAVWQDEPHIVNQLRRPDTNTLLPLILLNPAGTYLPHDAAPDTFVGSLALPIVSAELYDVLMNIFSVAHSSEKAHASDKANALERGSEGDSGANMAARLPLRILLVEDNHLNQRVLINMLDKLGYQVDVAANGQIAVDMTSQIAFDVILMDIQMPVMDGMEATQQIRARCGARQRPYIVAVTAHALEGDREYYLTSGMDAYLSKPITLNQLVETLYQSRDRVTTCSSTTSVKPAIPGRSSTGQADEPASAIDFAELSRLIEGDPRTFLQSMAPIFLQDTQKVLHSLSQGVQEANIEAIITAAHTLKGTSASMACKTLAQACRELEMKAKANDLTAAPQQLQKIVEEYGRVQIALANQVETAV